MECLVVSLKTAKNLPGMNSMKFKQAESDKAMQARQFDIEHGYIPNLSVCLAGT